MLRSTASVLLLSGLASAGLAQSWSQVTTANDPGDFRDGAMAYDVITGKVLLFGGWPALGATWLYDGTDWQQATPATSPSGRREFAMATDLLRGRVVLFGGRTAAAVAGDTWEWDGSNWIAMSPATSPPARTGHVMAFDSARGVTVLFGGTTDPLRPNTRTDTWEWNGVNWTQVTTAVAPTEAESSSMCFDPQRGVCVLTGGTSFFGAPDQKTWEYDGVNWSDVSAAVGLAPTAVPGLGVTLAGMVFDLGCGVAVLHGGRTPNGTFPTDTWTYDGAAWSLVATGSPSPRTRYSMAYDYGRGVSVLYGGLTGNFQTNYHETWEFSACTPASYTTFGGGCASSAGVAGNVATQLPQLGQSLAVSLAPLPAPEIAVFVLGFSNTVSNLGPLPVDLAVFGAPGCQGRVSDDATALLLGAGGAASFSLAIPNNPQLLGTTVHTQAVIFESGVNAFGGVVSDAATAVIGS